MNINLIEYIIKKTGVSQKDLADKLNVSREQISKWKSGESILHKRDDLMKIAGLFGDDPGWAILVKTEKNSQAWIKYILYMNESMEDYFQSSSLNGDPEFYAPAIIRGLAELGVSIPQKAPSVKKLLEDEYTKFDLFIDDYLQCYGPITEWCAKYLSSGHAEIENYELDITDWASDLSICHVDEKLLISNGVDPSKLALHREKTKHEIRRKIRYMCMTMKKKNIPFDTDYFDLINNGINTLNDELMFSDIASEHTDVETYFSYADRVLLGEGRKTNSLLESLHAKIDKLLANGK
jgi:transcriptional regulator with XRE-family HTH domain